MCHPPWLLLLLFCFCFVAFVLWSGGRGWFGLILRQILFSGLELTNRLPGPVSPQQSTVSPSPELGLQTCITMFSFLFCFILFCFVEMVSLYPALAWTWLCRPG